MGCKNLVQRSFSPHIAAFAFNAVISQVGHEADREWKEIEAPTTGSTVAGSGQVSFAFVILQLRIRELPRGILPSPLPCWLRVIALQRLYFSSSSSFGAYVSCSSSRSGAYMYSYFITQVTKRVKNVYVTVLDGI
jgi:hypothetical protein